MKTMQRIMASAIAIAVGLSSVYAADATNSWWTVDFESGYTENALIAGTSQSDGAWTGTAGKDVSSVVAATPPATGSFMGKLNTEGGDLIWTPTTVGAPTGLKKVLINTQVYMVGSEDVPSESTGTVQTEVFLTNAVVDEVTTSYLCAHVANGWVKLEGAPIEDQSWINLRIEIKYDVTPPQVGFFVNNIQMTDGTTEWFDVMASGAGQKTVTDVTFKGTGNFDNFIGRRVAIAPVFAGYESDDEGTTPLGAESIVEGPGTVTATFAGTSKYVQMKNSDGTYVRTVRVEGNVATFSTVGLPSGTYSITAYSGENAPSVIPSGYVPAAEATDDYKAAVVANDEITLNIVPVSGLYYTLFAGETVAEATAAAASTLAVPEDEDAGFLQISMPVPENANEVKIIKIVASDDPYALGDDIPAATPSTP